MGEVAQRGSERSQVAEPVPGVQVLDWLIPLEEMVLLSLGVQQRKRPCQVGVREGGADSGELSALPT